MLATMKLIFYVAAAVLAGVTVVSVAASPVGPPAREGIGGDQAAVSGTINLGVELPMARVKEVVPIHNTSNFPNPIGGGGAQGLPIFGICLGAAVGLPLAYPRQRANWIGVISRHLADQRCIVGSGAESRHWLFQCVCVLHFLPSGFRTGFMRLLWPSASEPMVHGGAGCGDCAGTGISGQPCGGCLSQTTKFAFCVTRSPSVHIYIMETVFRRTIIGNWSRKGGVRSRRELRNFGFRAFRNP